MNHSRPGLPVAMLLFSRIPTALLGAGFPLGSLYLLDTRGRRTGALRTVPARIFRHDGRRWLVSIFGETGWVANIRAAGTARLRRGRRVETIRCTEVTDGRRAEVAMQLRRTFSARINPFVRAAFEATPRDGLEAFQAEEHRHPVFLVDAD
jgi:deazaflavin-dependent oxidoreductase (nitroreductase family)